MTMPAIEQSRERLRVIRDLFPKCYKCAGSIRSTALNQLLKVPGKDRLAHKHCPCEDADDGETMEPQPSERPCRTHA